jgi:hypothetical protein
MGSSKGRAQVAAGLDRAISYLPSVMYRVLKWCSFSPLRPSHFLGRLFRFPDPLTELVQFGDLNKEIGRIIGENCKPLLKRTHHNPPTLHFWAHFARAVPSLGLKYYLWKTRINTGLL